jgi:hypothetical protein
MAIIAAKHERSVGTPNAAVIATITNEIPAEDDFVPAQKF